MKTTSWARTCHLTILAVGALGLMLAAAPARAQGDEYQGDDQYQDQSTNDEQGPADDAAYDQMAGEDEAIVVTAPRPGVHLDSPGAPSQQISLSREVAFDDLDLRAGRGVRELKARIRDTARDICSELDVAYPGAPGDSVSCYRRAVQGAMNQADDAIADARGYAYNE